MVSMRGFAMADSTRVRVDSTAVVDGARSAVRRFLAQWRAAWMQTEDERRPNAFRVVISEAGAVAASPPGWQRRIAMRRQNFLHERTRHRILALHCHSDVSLAPQLARHLIRSPGGGQAACPTWIDEGHPTHADEAEVLDSALAPDARPAIMAARIALLAQLDRAVAQLPHDPWLAGQRVRFLVDAGRTDAALAAVRACRASASWCAMLAAYVHHWRGEVPLADSAFAAERAALPDTLRCAWDDVGALLAPAARGVRTPLVRGARERQRAALVAGRSALRRAGERAAHRAPRAPRQDGPARGPGAGRAACVGPGPRR
jgi:hypothetical protein